MKKAKIAVVGLGYVGLPLAVLAAKKGYGVVGIDISKERVGNLSVGKLPFKDPLLARNLKKSKMNFTTDFTAVADAKIVVICVPTPVYENRLPNYFPVKQACESVGKNLTKGTLVILESTVNPGVCDEIVIPILEKASGLKIGEFQLAHCPERINPGDVKWDVSNISRVVGGYDAKSLSKAYRFYNSIISAPITKMKSLKEAEAVKIVENSFRNINIAFVNELAQSFAMLGIDVVNVINGAATKPFAFLAHYPGIGVGGHCIPVDPYYLIDYAKKNGFKHRFLSLACKVNEEMPEFTAQLVQQSLKHKGVNIKKAKVTVLGLAYKRNIDDVRESPSFRVIDELKSRGAKVVSYDPFVRKLSDADTLDEAIKGSDAVVLATDHKTFMSDLKPGYLESKGVKVLIDGRNCLDKDKFTDSRMLYRGIGK